MGVREVLDGYPYLNNLIQLCPGDCFKYRDLRRSEERRGSRYCTIP